MTIVNSRDKIREQAVLLARENKRAEPRIEKVYWFPDDEEVRLVDLDENAGLSLSGYLEPFYFDPSPEDDLDSPSGIALIRKDEFGKLKLPDGWCDWNDAEELDLEE